MIMYSCMPNRLECFADTIRICYCLNFDVILDWRGLRHPSGNKADCLFELQLLGFSEQLLLTFWF